MYQFLVLLEIVVLILMNLALPSKSRPSPIGVSLCGGWFWAIQMLFLAFCGLTLWFTIWYV
jgi:uncharacterized membrane protein YfcA